MKHLVLGGTLTSFQYSKLPVFAMQAFITFLLKNAYRSVRKHQLVITSVVNKAQHVIHELLLHRSSTVWIQAAMTPSVSGLFTLIPPSIARLLLLNNEWQLETVTKKFLTDPIELLVEQHIVPPRSASPTASDSPSVMATIRAIQRKSFPVHPYLIPPKSSADSSCVICFSTPSPNGPKLEFFPEYSEKPVANPPHVLGTGAVGSGMTERSVDACSASGLYGLSCGHRFCADCWSSYLVLQVSEANSTDMRCMATSCDIFVPEDFLLTILKGSPMKDKYLKFIFRQMVASHPLLRFCSGVDCSVVIHALEPPKARRVKCSNCHEQFCFLCGEAYHAPASCDTMKRWLLKCREDLGTSTYMQAHTKDCPECHVCIEKNGGCNHMVSNRLSALVFEFILTDFHQGYY
ncbi:unnamed protein product [Echinostoma caproni]|uniref:RBR-type E3 ubiquitin transferase n=1 Tax=Echinostoma caproni TaxID=27848 RepID=A0A183A1E5_9TREM|nr:unnamed protein product [Echinostoma caproni]